MSIFFLTNLHTSLVTDNMVVSSIPSYVENTESKKISNDQELTQSDPKSCSQNQKGNN